MAVDKRVAGGVAGVVGVILASVFAMEGGYVNNPKDPGGETNHGITKAVAVEHGYTAPMIDLPKTYAEQIYRQDYIEKPGYLPVIELSTAVGHKLVDAGVNAGTSRSSRWFQTSLNALNRGGKDYPAIFVDGKVGADTVRAYQSLQTKRGKVTACEMVVKLVDAQQAAHYMSLTNLTDFTPGWIDHRIGNVPISRCSE